MNSVISLAWEKPMMDRENTGNTFGASDRNKIRKVSFPQ